MAVEASRFAGGVTSVVTKPNFLIAGAARSGTTALAQILSQHPDVFLTDPKETHFFAHVDRKVTYTAPGDDLTVNRHLISDPERYYGLYSGAEGHLARGEGSVSSLYLHERSIPAIQNYAAADVKVIAILREPAARAYSSYLYLRGRGFEDRQTFEEALTLESERLAAGYHHMWQLRGMSRYGQQVSAFAEAFGDRFKVLIFEEYREQPRRHLAELCEFLGVPATFEFQTDIEINRGGQPRSHLMTRAMNEIRSLPRMRRLVKAATPEVLRESIRQANLQRPDADTDTFERLQTEFTPDVEQVEKVVKRTIPAWQRS